MHIAVALSLMTLSLLNTEEPGAGVPAPFLLGTASPMDKIFREAADYKGPLNGPLRIAAAGRERESFQVVCVPLAAPLKGVQVEVSDLVRVDGGDPFPAARVSWHPVGYIKTVPSNSAIRRTGWEWPDVLMPAQPFDVEPGFVQPVWFTVDVPENTAPGLYKGTITFAPAGMDKRSIDVELTVRAFSLPLRGKLRTAFCMSPGIWEAWYKPDEVRQRLGQPEKYSHGPLYTSYECEDVLPHEKWLEVYDFLLAHRISPTVIYSGMKNGRTRTVPAREDMQYCYDRGMNATCLGNCDVLSGDAATADKQMADFEEWFRDWEGFVKEKDWKDFTWYVHGFDESEMRKDPENSVDPYIRRVYGMIGEKFPWLKRETANPYTAKNVGYFDIWTPLTQQLSGDLVPYRERQAAGDQLWAYVCCGPGKPYANFFIDFPGVDPRILGWQYFRYNVTGFLYYLINLYEQEENWNQNGPKWPERDWNPFSFNTNSDGILIYPGPDMTPLASTRLENIRDGIEDYEALAMLKDLVAALEKKCAAGDLLARAREAVAVRPEVTASWTEYTQDPARITAARNEVDELIEECLRTLAEAKNN